MLDPSQILPCPLSTLGISHVGVRTSSWQEEFHGLALTIQRGFVQGGEAVLVPSWDVGRHVQQVGQRPGQTCSWGEFCEILWEKKQSVWVRTCGRRRVSTRAKHGYIASCQRESSLTLWKAPEESVTYFGWPRIYLFQPSTSTSWFTHLTHASYSTRPINQPPISLTPAENASSQSKRSVHAFGRNGLQ